PIVTEPGGRAWRQTIFHPFAQAARYGRGEVLRVEPVSPLAGDVPALHATAVLGDDATLTLFAVNRSRSDALELAATVRAFGAPRILEHSALADPDLHARNTADNPNRVRPHPNGTSAIGDGTLHAILPPVSWNVIRLDIG